MTYCGTVFQAVGTLLLTLPIWGPTFTKRRTFYVDAGMLTDRRGWWPKLVKVGLFLYLLGYILIIAAWPK